VTHELGHVLGFEHSGKEGVMYATLDAGVRELPTNLWEPALPTSLPFFGELDSFAIDDVEPFIVHSARRAVRRSAAIYRG
jgi:hypothetical protein